ncbi:peptidoglycan-binding protein [Bradyrhizobium sp. STM 3557]|uniref:peptidoglycan-binding protein n=1 Tax=Bradyrhizobium sp. STM 3557 TaxID=578920 RepID=UPI00388E4CFD
MRSLSAATWMSAALLLAGSPVLAQTTPPAAAGVKADTKPKPVATVPVRPAAPASADPASTMTQADRQALQSDLAWTGQYNGTISGDASERMVNAVKDYKKQKGGSPTGLLNPQERAALADTARRKQESVGWKIVTDPVSGARLGLPTKLVPQQTSDASGSIWSAADGTVQVQLSRRKQANPTTSALADREKTDPPGRVINYAVVKPDFFVLSGLQGQKKFYIRGTFKGDEVRILTILYDQATESTVAPIVIAMSSAFTPFPVGVTAPPPRRSVDYGTGIVVSEDGAIVADREVTDGCLAITIPNFGHADRIAEDKQHGLALLRVYGARGLKPLALDGGGASGNVDLIGIADPQSQGGAAAVTSAKAQAVAGTGDIALAPPPAFGFSGAAARDASGKFAGIALLKQAIVAGPANASPGTQAILVAPDMVRRFLTGHGVTLDGNSSDAKAAAVRVICVRK